MKLKRIEILLPLNHNDGRPIERVKFRLTHEELLEKFGGTTVDSVRAWGHWKYRGTLYRDQLIRVRIDTADARDAYKFLRSYKETLKARFEQIDIWITAHDVEVL